MVKKQSTPPVSTIASKVLAGKTQHPKKRSRWPHRVLSQDESKGQKPAPKKG